MLLSAVTAERFVAVGCDDLTFHMSVTVPCDASNSLMIDPSSLTPFSTDVRKPGERCTWSR